MNRKVLLGVVIALTVITALIHLSLGAGMAFGGPGRGGPRPGGGQFQNGGGGGPQANGTPPADVTPQAGGQFPDGGQGNGGGPGGGQFPGGGRQGGPGGGLFAVMRFLPWLFLLNALGYILLLVLLAFKVPYFKDHAALVHWLLIAFAAVTFIGYFAINGADRFLGNPLALVAKVDEVLLIVFTFLHLRSLGAGASAAPAAPPAAPAA